MYCPFNKFTNLIKNTLPVFVTALSYTPKHVSLLMLREVTVNLQVISSELGGDWGDLRTLLGAPTTIQ